MSVAEAADRRPRWPSLLLSRPLRPANVTEARTVALLAAATAAVVAYLGSAILEHPIAFGGLVLATGIAAYRRPIIPGGAMLLYATAAMLILGCDAQSLNIGIVLLAVTNQLAFVERRALRFSAALQDARDSLWRLVGLLVTAILAIVTADRVEWLVVQRVYATPLEALAPGAGLLAGVLLLVILGAMVWSLPRMFSRRISAGLSVQPAASDTLWFGIAAGTLALALDVRALAAAGTFRMDAGRNSILATVAVLAYAIVRVRLPTVIEADLQPLWVLVLAGRIPARAVRHHAAALADRWTSGPVTIVAPPQAALSLGGVHSRLAAIQGQLEGLFPQRPIHFADWLATLPPPDRWQSLPVRELYVDRALWPDLIAAQVDANALVVALDEAEPNGKAVDLLRTLLPTATTSFHLPASVGESAITSRWPAVEVHGIVGAPDARIAAWIEANGKTRATAPGGRIVIIEYLGPDADFARTIAKALRGKKDINGRRIAALRRRADAGGVARFLLQTMTNNWIHGLEARQVRANSQRWWKEPLPFLFAAVMIPEVRNAEYDLLVIDHPRMPTPGRAEGAPYTLLQYADRIVAIPSRERGKLSMEVAPFCTAVLPRPEHDGDVAELVRRFLALEFDPAKTGSDTVAEMPEIPLSQRSRPRVYIIYSSKDSAIADQLKYRLQQWADVSSPQGIPTGEAFFTAITNAIDDSDAVIPVVTSTFPMSAVANAELKYAQERRKIIIPVVSRLEHLTHPLLKTSERANLLLTDPITSDALDLIANGIAQRLRV